MLADGIYRASVEALGASERLQIAGLVNGAARMVFDGPLVDEVGKAFDRAAWEFERNLDVLEPLTGPEWIEWPVDGGEGHVMAGCLMAPHPELWGVTAFVTCLGRQGERPECARAVAWVDLESLYRIAWAARESGARDREATLSRLMEAVGVSVPDGFSAEIGILSESPDGEGDAMRFATATVPFALALLVASKSTGGCRVVERGGVARAELVSRRPGLVERAAGALGVGLPEFSRTLKAGRPVLEWRRPA